MEREGNFMLMILAMLGGGALFAAGCAFGAGLVLTAQKGARHG